MYSYRDIPREAASRAARIHLDALDKLIRRHAIGGKRRGARVFSLRDLVTLKAARNLSGPDLTIADALAICGPLLAEEPPGDAVLVLTEDGQSWLQSQADDWPECNCRLVPVGRIKLDMEAALVAL